MLTRLRIRNFKTFGEADIPLGQNVVFVGANNSGKTSALQALALWKLGLDQWISRRSGTSKARTRTGVVINRRELTHTPVSSARLLWHDRRVNVVKKENGSQDTQYIYLDIVVDGETDGQAWSCGLEFYHQNSEAIVCRPLRLDETQSPPPRMEVPEIAQKTKVALLPPMSGLTSEEAELQPGRVSVLLGEGQTAQVLRNLCWQVFSKSTSDWQAIQDQVKRAFGVRLGEPARDPARGTIELSYFQRDIELDLPSSGRGMQQTLLLLSHLHANPGSTLLLDEPDAHLEIIRQRQIYDLITEAARRTGSQIVAASHSEVVFNEAGERDVLVAFVGTPHRIDQRGTQARKALSEIRFDQYLQAEQKGWVLYLEGATDLQILISMARRLGHPAEEALSSSFVYYVGNQPTNAQDHFYGLQEAYPTLRAIAVFDRLERGLPNGFRIENVVWKKREIENYICSEDVLVRFAVSNLHDDLVGRAERSQRTEAMLESIERASEALKTLKGVDPWNADVKVSDDFLPAVFRHYYSVLGLENEMSKSDFHVLAAYLEPSEIHSEVRFLLDSIVRVAGANS
jgi:ABC-type nitrate/sulfonate/bicarbonate transport system ATPase subunit